MNRREFVGLTALVPLLASASGFKDVLAGKPLVVLPESARVYDIGQGQVTILVDTARSQGAWWLGSFLSDPGRKTSLHVHFSADEQFYVIEGVLSLWVNDRWQELPAGSVAAMPRGVPHALGNRGKQPVRFLASGNPAGFEGFFVDIEALARHLRYGSPEFLAELKRLYPKYDSQLLGAPPPG